MNISSLATATSCLDWLAFKEKCKDPINTKEKVKGSKEVYELNKDGNLKGILEKIN